MEGHSVCTHPQTHGLGRRTSYESPATTLLYSGRCALRNPSLLIKKLRTHFSRTRKSLRKASEVHSKVSKLGMPRDSAQICVFLSAQICVFLMPIDQWFLNSFRNLKLGKVCWLSGFSREALEWKKKKGNRFLVGS